MSDKARVRFAPSPTGNLHLGSARTALFNWLFAKSQSGQFILRIEDTDRARSASEFERSILGDLQWLGLNWDEGPGIGGPFAPYHQSKRQEIYRKIAEELLEKGRAYHCYCSSEELEASRQKARAEGKTPPVYRGRCLRISKEQKARFEREGRKPVLRFRVPEAEIIINDLINGQVQFDSSVIGDFILLRSDGSASFNFANVVDDALMEITHVIRGNDHLSNTPRHIMLFEALGRKPPQFAHHSLLLGTDRTKMSKRHGATAVFEYRERGYLPNAMVNYLVLLSWSPGDDREIFDLDDLAREFSIKGISKSPAVFDIDKLNWINRQHILRTKLETLTDLTIGLLDSADVHSQGITRALEPEEFADLSNKIDLIRERATTLLDIPKELSVLVLDSIELTDEAKEMLARSESHLVLQSLAAILDGCHDLEKEISREILGKLTQEMGIQGIKGKAVFMPVRLALTGETSGPDLSDLLSGLGREKSLERIRSALRHVSEEQDPV